MAEKPATSRWVIYLRERSPFVPLTIIALAQSLSSAYLVRDVADVRAVILSTTGILGLLVLLRMMDELKDCDKDRVAHPGRPIPRGLITQAEMRRAVFMAGAMLLVYAAVTALALNVVAGALFVATVVYAFLMYAEFFASRQLARNAFVYALTHQPIVIPMYAFAVAASSPDDALSARSLWWALTGLAASFAFELARKMNPDANQVLGTYLHRHGRPATTVALLLALALLAVSSFEIGVHRITWPFIALALISLAVLSRQPRRHTLVEAVVTVLGFSQMLAPTLARALRAFA